MQLQPDTSIVKSNIATENVASQGTLGDNVSLSNKRFDEHQRTYFRARLRGLDEGMALKQTLCSSAELFAWKQQPEFLAFDRLVSKELAIAGPKAARELMLESSYSVVETMVKRATDIDRRDSQRAGETILEVAGVITKTPSVIINNSVQQLSARLMQSQAHVTDTDAQSHDDAK